jgi:ribosomal protein S12 methylthiotransferase accessory factor YcaO
MNKSEAIKLLLKYDASCVMEAIEKLHNKKYRVMGQHIGEENKVLISGVDQDTAIKIHYAYTVSNEENYAWIEEEK